MICYYLKVQFQGQRVKDGHYATPTVIISHSYSQLLANIYKDRLIAK